MAVTTNNLGVGILQETFTEVYTISQEQGSNGYLVKETSAGVWESEFDIDLKSNQIPDVQAVVNTYSGLTAGTTEFTAQQLFDMATASGGDITIRFLEEVDGSITVPVEKEETIVSRIDFAGLDGKIHSFKII